MEDNTSSSAAAAAGQKEDKEALQLALQEFDGIKVDNIIRQGFDVRNIYLDQQKFHTALHELVLNYVMIPKDMREPKQHMKFIDTLTVLLQHKLNINEKDYKQQTVLHMAAANPGHPEIIKTLLTSGAKVNQPDSGQQTPLHKAVIHGSREDVITLLKGGADPNFMDNMGHSPIHVAVKRKQNIEILNELVAQGGKVSLNHPEQNQRLKGASPLHMAARLGRVDNAIKLLSMSANPNIVDATGQTPLHIAATNEITGKLCEALLRLGAKIDLPDSIFGETALHKAVKAGMFENIRVLVRAQANPNVPDFLGNTALHKAAISNCTDFTIWQSLINKGGKMNTVNKDGDTPLAIVHKSNNRALVSLLRFTLAET